MARGRKPKYINGLYRLYLSLPQDFAAKFRSRKRLRQRMEEAIRAAFPATPWDEGPADLSGTDFEQSPREETEQ